MHIWEKTLDSSQSLRSERVETLEKAMFEKAFEWKMRTMVLSPLLG